MRQSSRSRVLSPACPIAARSVRRARVEPMGSHRAPSPIIKKAPVGSPFYYWWRRWDSNPRYAINVYTLSKRAPSAAQPLLHILFRLRSGCEGYPSATPGSIHFSIGVFRWINHTRLPLLCRLGLRGAKWHIQTCIRIQGLQVARHTNTRPNTRLLVFLRLMAFLQITFDGSATGHKQQQTG